MNFDKDNLPWRLYQASKLLQVSTLELRFFNMAMGHIVFFAKQSNIIICILSGFVGVRQMSESNYLTSATASFACFISVSTLICFFNLAYKVTETMRVLKYEVIRRSHELGDRAQRTELRMRMAAIPSSLGLKCGSFQTIERESSLVVIDFVSRQVVSLLITF